jgi:hypothetical protein
MPAALEAVASAYRDHGMTHGREVDFVNFYGCVTNVEALAEILRPLPASVVENVVWDHSMRAGACAVPVVSTTVRPTPSVPTGLSLGSVTSPIVGEAIVARLLVAAGAPETITYADNLFVLGRSREEVEVRIDRIRESAAVADVGTLGLRSTSGWLDHDLQVPFEFLKHQANFRNGAIRWQPGSQKMLQFQIAEAERLSLNQIEVAEKRIRNIRRAYPGWEDGHVAELKFLAALAARKFYLQPDGSNHAAAVRTLIEAACAAAPAESYLDILPDDGELTGQYRTAIINGFSAFINSASSQLANSSANE